MLLWTFARHRHKVLAASSWFKNSAIMALFLERVARTFARQWSARVFEQSMWH